MRLVNRILVATLGLALVGASVVGLVEMVFATFDRGPWAIPYDDWKNWAEENRWDDARALGWVFAGLVVAGAMLLAAQIVRRRPSAFLLHDDPVAASEIPQREVQRTVRRAVEDVEGVESADVRLGRGRLRVRARSHLRHPEGVDERIQSAVRGRLAEVGIEQVPKLMVAVQPREDQ